MTNEKTNPSYPPFVKGGILFAHPGTPKWYVRGKIMGRKQMDSRLRMSGMTEGGWIPDERCPK